MDAATRAAVRRRAGDRCEYCLLRQEHDLSALHVEHIAAKQHGGTDDPANLALACIHWKLQTRCLHCHGLLILGVPERSPAFVRLMTTSALSE